MSYQVLARKWRPRKFSEMVGQEHVLRAIINALDNDRLHHAFLFTGTRGVGKTTIARILAKSLNCEGGVSSTPCGECAACTEIDEGRFVDLIEVDAASRTKVEDTREILDNVQYAPTRGRYKVYLIDEVHMLSRNSFNALLKTLEEPPPHIKFLLATTDPQKLPVTILSRCLQFNLKRLPQSLIFGHLVQILKAEDIQYEDAAIHELAHAADGSVRDALSLMDQGIAFGQGRLAEADIRLMLGTIDRASIFPLVDALAAADAARLLAGVDHIAESAPDFTILLEELISVFHRMALEQLIPDSSTDEWTSESNKAEIKRLASILSAEDIQLYYQIAVNGRRDLPHVPEPRAGLEMVLLRMLAFRPMTSSEKPVQSGRQVPMASPDTQVISPDMTTESRQSTAQESVKLTPLPGDSEDVSSTSNNQPVASADNWGEIVESLTLTGMLKQLAVNCLLVKQDEHSIHLQLDEAHAHLGRDSMRQRLEKSLQVFFGLPVKVVLNIGAPTSETPAAQQQRIQTTRLQDAEEAIRNDEAVQALQDVFDGRIVPDTVQPVGS